MEEAKHTTNSETNDEIFLILNQIMKLLKNLKTFQLIQIVN